MKMKIKMLAATLGMLSANAFAAGYNTQLDFDYLSEDGFDIVEVSGSYYFDKVTVSGTAWAEAAFTGRKNNVSVSYLDFDGDASLAAISAEFFGNKTNNLYGSLAYATVDSDFGGSDSIIMGEVGYFVAENWLVSLAASSSDGVDPIILSTKYVSKLGGGRFLNLEANIDDESNDLSVAGDYYFAPQSSFGLELSQADGFDYGLNFQHFFAKSLAMRVGFIKTDADNATTIGLTARF